MKYTVTSHKKISAQKDKIYEVIANLNNWQAWSPWACLEPSATQMQEADDMTWDGKFTGAGKMKIISRDANNIYIDLTFLKPFKSSAKVHFSLTANNENETSITWKMDSSLPFFMFFFKKLFEVMIRKDFDRGLTRLQYLVETGSIPSRLEFTDTPVIVNSFKTIGISEETSMANIATSMKNAFTRLHVLSQKYSIVPTVCVCFCDNYKITKEIMQYTASAVYDGKTITPNEMTNRIIPDHKAIKVTLYGSYDFMGDGWSALYSRFRGLKLKADKRVAPYEKYITGPHNSDNPASYITEIYMPVK